METAIGAAGWLVGKVLNKLSDDLVAAYVASSELGLNSEQINTKLKYMQGLLEAAQSRDVSRNRGLQSLLEDLSKKADEAEDALDELHYFMIQDQLDGTQEAVPELGDDLRGHALHVHHATRSTFGKWLTCFSCTRPKHIDRDAIAVVTNNRGGGLEKLTFNRVAMSHKIKLVIESIHSLCDPVSDLLNKIPNSSTSVTLKRPPTGSTVAQDILYGRKVIFEKTVNALTRGRYDNEALSVLPFVGPGGMGKTTFTQHLYNDERIERHFAVRVWICASTDFDVIKLTRQILSGIPKTEEEEEEEENNRTNETTSLDQLQKSIIRRLKSKRILVVLDDIWKFSSQAAWKNLLAPFTKGEIKGSVVLVTTRFPSIAKMVKTTDPVELHGLDPNDFFAFFEACIFGHSKPRHYEDDLIEVARDIAKKLKGSPLAANTVGRLLKKNLSREYWIGVLEKNEWKNTKNDDDIMPSLKISYDYLPFDLQKCFSYCALFPQGHRFSVLEITQFWIAIGILDPSSPNTKNYLEELVENGFIMKGDDKFGQYYVMHDLLHELSRNVSSQECVNISSLHFRAYEVPQSIRHLSITIEDLYDESFVGEISRLKSRIDIGNLRSLMIFGLQDVRIGNVLKDTFREIKGLRVLFIAMNNPLCLSKSFSNLIHLQYLKISSPFGLEMTLPSTLSRFYHLKFLDLEDWHGSEKLPKDISRLVNLHHLHSSKELHSNIPEVGKMKCLQELKEFNVKKESVGFELRELGELIELGGELSICNLDTVASKTEASGAKLKNKRNLKELRLVWCAEHQTIHDDVLDGLHPPPNLRLLAIINPGVAPVPSWLFSDISTKRLESLHLEGVSWGTLPPFEQLSHLSQLILKNIAGMRVLGPGFGGVTDRSFMYLKAIVLEDMPDLVEWVGGPNGHLFSRFESIKIKDCLFLRSFPFLEFSGHFTNLCRLDVDNCPNLSRFPAMPHTSTLTYARVEEYGRPKLLYDGMKLTVDGFNGSLVFQNMNKVEVLKIRDVANFSLSDLQKQKSLRCLDVKRCNNIFSEELDDSIILHSVQDLRLEELCTTGELFSKMLKCFPALSQLRTTECRRLYLLPVKERGSFQLEEFVVDSISLVLVPFVCRHLAATLHTLEFRWDMEVETFTQWQEQALQLLISLQRLKFGTCNRLRFLPKGLQHLSSLRELVIFSCGKLRSLPHQADLPASLQTLQVLYCSPKLTEKAEKLKETDRYFSALISVTVHQIL
ncbi:putative disease resistance protein RGA4 [Aegilops tauschii subsp. strangulata]|uniref:putative disease resistance protein RGA4 n=1 Tax=Aegilops tauschii subsp. strangulata TaxID=200361 RepID=UPI000989EB4E